MTLLELRNKLIILPPEQLGAELQMTLYGWSHDRSDIMQKIFVVDDISVSTDNKVAVFVGSEEVSSTAI